MEVSYISESDNCRAVRLKALKPGSTDSAEGMQIRSCTKCGAQETQTIPKLEKEHSDLYIEGVSVEDVITYFKLYY